MNDGEIVQSGYTSGHLHDEPLNHFVATFIGESNILPEPDWGLLVEVNGKRFEAVDGGMKLNEPVEVVIRPDLRITLPEEESPSEGWYSTFPWGTMSIAAYDELANEWWSTQLS